MIKNTNSYGLLIFRVSLGVVLLAHSFYLKFFIYTLSGTAGYFESIGLPSWMAYVVFITEVAAGVLIILGFQTRMFSALVVPILTGATWAHWSNGWLFTYENGGWEYPLFLAFMAVSLVLTGPGKFALDNRKIEQHTSVHETGMLTNQ
ncbi:DoxX family protein [Sessilibacter corallicola]|uniref:DoxX family protein n=1 Tax=Sessilibacter corallicola TaxID=2904075 RepID=A0ABQ0A9N0_9GAMM